MEQAPSTPQSVDTQFVVGGLLLTVLISIPIAWLVAKDMLAEEAVRKADDNRRQTLYNLSYALDARANTEGTYPESLDALEGEPHPDLVGAFRYETEDAGRFYSLCTTYSNGEEECREGAAPEGIAEARELVARENEEPSWDGDALTNARFNYRVEFPESWSLGKMERGGGFVLYYSPANHASFQLSATPAVEAGLSWYGDLRTRTLSGDLSSFSVLSDTNTTFKGMPARRIVYSWMGGNGVASWTEMLLFSSGEYFYEFDQTTAASNITTFAPAFESIGASFELID